MQHKLILFTSSSPGAGKSTLSRLLYRQLAAQHIPARWLHEEDIVAAFERFVPALSHDDLTPESLLQASTALVAWCHSENTTFIVDSFLPGFYYLYGRYSQAQIETYSADLCSTLNALQPLVIYLRSDVETALMRGARQRGMQWLENITRYLNGWQLPLYGGPPKPLRTVPDVIHFFTRVDRLAVPLLAKWPATLVLEAAQTSLNELGRTIFAQLALVEQRIDSVEPGTDIRRYVGSYTPADDKSAAAQLEVSLVDDALFVNTYWPAGARLLPEGEARFHLEGTNRDIVFTCDKSGEPFGLLYTIGQTTERYKKIN